MSALAILRVICAIIAGMRIGNREALRLVWPRLVRPALHLVGGSAFGHLLPCGR